MNIYAELSRILGTYITKDNFETELKILDQSGRVTQKGMLDILVILCKMIDETTNKTSEPV